MESPSTMEGSALLLGNGLRAHDSDILKGNSMLKTFEDDTETTKPATASRESSVVERASASRSPPERRSRKLASEWDSDDVQRYLKSIGLEELQEVFREHQVTGLVLLSLTEEDLHRSLGIQKFGPRRRLIIGLAELREEEIAASTAKNHHFPYGPNLIHRPNWSTTTTGTSGGSAQESDTSTQAHSGGLGPHCGGSVSVVSIIASPTATPTPGGVTPLAPASPRSTGTCSPLPRSNGPSIQDGAGEHVYSMSPDAARCQWTNGGPEVVSSSPQHSSSISPGHGAMSWTTTSQSPVRGRGVRTRSPTPSMSPSLRSSLTSQSFSKRQLLASPPRRPTPNAPHGAAGGPESGTSCGSLTAPAGQPRLSPVRVGRHPGVSGHFGSPSSSSSSMSGMSGAVSGTSATPPSRNGPLSRPSSSRATSPPGLSTSQRDRLVSQNGLLTRTARTTSQRSGADKTPKKGTPSVTSAGTPLGTPAATPANTPAATPVHVSSTGAFNLGTPPPTSFTAPSSTPSTAPVVPATPPPIIGQDASATMPVLGRPQSASMPPGCSPMSWFENVREAPSMASPPPRTGSPINSGQTQLRSTPRHTPSPSPSPGSVVQAALAHVHAVLNDAHPDAEASASKEAQHSFPEQELQEESSTMQESESELSETRGVMSWPMQAWGEIQAAQHRHTRAWVVARALTTANGLPQAMAREAAQLRTMARDIDVQILLPAASAVSGGNRGSVMDTSSASSASSFAARRPFVHLYTERLLGDVLEDLACRASARSAQAEVAARACIGRLEEALLNRLSAGVDGRRPRSLSSTGGQTSPKQGLASVSPMPLRREYNRDGRGGNHTPSQAGKGLRTGSPNSGSSSRVGAGVQASGASTPAANLPRPASPANVGGNSAAVPEGTASGSRPLWVESRMAQGMLATERGSPLTTYSMPGAQSFSNVTAHNSPARGAVSPMRPMPATSMAFMSTLPSK